MGVAVGIDLGTSNSCVAVVRDGVPVVLTDAEGRTTQPSVVAFGHGDTVVVGPRARRQLAHAPENVVVSVKRLIGRRFRAPEVQRVRHHSSYVVLEGKGGDCRIRVQGRTFTPEEVSAYILRHMKDVAERALGETVDSAVITVPAYFNDKQRQATRDAASIAGLECLRILNEPTAAALAHGYQKGRRQHLVVYDLGGGTFDVSILRVDDDFFEVVSTAGDTFLGGDDFDYIVAEHFLGLLQRQIGRDIEENRTVRLRLREAAERAKIALSTLDEVEVHVPAIWRNAEGTEYDFRTTVDRYAYANWVMPLVRKTFQVCDEALQNASMSTRQVDAVLMVGGMTRYPLIREAATQYFGRLVDTSVNPDEAVAIGAAIQAWTLTSTTDAPASVLLDVTPQSLSVRTLGGWCDTLIPRNTPVPTEATKVFHTAFDEQTEVRIAVYQGESRRAEENEPLGEFVLADLPPLKRGQVRVKVTFELDTDGILHVRAVDDQLGREQSIRIEARGGVSPDELAAARQRQSETRDGLE